VRESESHPTSKAVSRPCEEEEEPRVTVLMGGLVWVCTTGKTRPRVAFGPHTGRKIATILAHPGSSLALLLLLLLWRPPTL
jgi:hypothetical protein